MWHENTRFGGTTRNPQPPVGFAMRLNLDDVLGLDGKQLRRFKAIHEAGHAVVESYFGMPLEKVELAEGTHYDGTEYAGLTTNAPGVFTVATDEWTSMLAAGERACDRWLRSEVLWTPARGWATEMAAQRDRSQISRSVRNGYGHGLTYGFRDAPTDLETIHGFADELIDELWWSIKVAAEQLDGSGRLSGDDVAAAMASVRAWQKPGS